MLWFHSRFWWIRRDAAFFGAGGKAAGTGARAGGGGRTWSAMKSWWRLNNEGRERRKSSRRTDPRNGHDMNETAEFIPAERKASWSPQACTNAGECERITPNFVANKFIMQ